MPSEALDYRYLPSEPDKTLRVRPRAVHGANGTFMAGALCPHCQRHAMTGRHILADAPCPVCAKRPSGK